MQVTMISLDQLLPPVVIMREDVDQEQLRELAADIRARGLLHPIIVTPHEGKYRVVAGWRRKVAADMAEILEVPCVVMELDEEGEIQTMLRENLHREHPNPVDEAKMFQVMLEGLHITVEGMALRTGVSQAYIHTRLAILHGPEDVREALRAGNISLSVARELQRCSHEDDRQYCLYYAVLGGATTDLVRRWVNERNLARIAQPTGPAPTGAPSTVSPHTELLGRCDWHKGQVPLDKCLSFQVCGDCYLALNNLRDEMAKQPDDKEVTDHDVGSTRATDGAPAGNGDPGGH